MGNNAVKERYITIDICNDLKEKMVFVGGPRQVGKTTLSLYIARNYYKSFQYLNWDNRDDRKEILKSIRKPDTELIIYDEIHKYQSWKNYLKGEYDKHKDEFGILVTGSARLDIYRKGGDSLLGRYRYYRLHPFSLSEFLGKNPVYFIDKNLKRYVPNPLSSYQYLTRADTSRLISTIGEYRFKPIKESVDELFNSSSSIN